MQNRRLPLTAACIAVPARVLATLRYAGQRALDVVSLHAFRGQSAVAPAKSRRRAGKKPKGAETVRRHDLTGLIVCFLELHSGAASKTGFRDHI